MTATVGGGVVVKVEVVGGGVAVDVDEVSAVAANDEERSTASTVPQIPAKAFRAARTRALYVNAPSGRC